LPRLYPTEAPLFLKVTTLLPGVEAEGLVWWPTRPLISLSQLALPGRGPPVSFFLLTVSHHSSLLLFRRWAELLQPIMWREGETNPSKTGLHVIKSRPEIFGRPAGGGSLESNDNPTKKRLQLPPTTLSLHAAGPSASRRVNGGRRSTQIRRHDHGFPRRLGLDRRRPRMRLRPRRIQTQLCFFKFV
jgi:hypothetical protein